MAPAQWRQVEEIFDSALELAPPRRSAFLDQACAGDLLLRGEVETLLACADRADGAPYLVMELIEGQSLKKRLAGPLPVGEVLGSAPISTAAGRDVLVEGQQDIEQRIGRGQQLTVLCS